MKKTHLVPIIALVILILLFSPVLAAVSPHQILTAGELTILESDWQFESNQAHAGTLDHREMMVASGCDVDNDGFEDILIGKRDYDSSSVLDSGRAWMFYGSENGLSLTPDVTIDPPVLNTYGFFGQQVACAGKLNNDNYDDILITMSNYDSIYSDEGAVFVWYGSENGIDGSYDWMGHGNNTYAHLGLSADSAGDVNGDGYDDIIVGAYRYDTNNIAHAYVWFGGEFGLGNFGTPSNADWVASDPGSSSGYGYSVRGIGDINNDTYDEVLVGAHLYDGGTTDQGAVFVYLGSGTGLGDPGTTANADWMAASGQASSGFGYSGDGIGDVNNDGIDDLAVGASSYDNPETNEGAAFVWYGAENFEDGDDGDPGNADWMAEGNNAVAFGYEVRPAGDVNGDLIDDMVITAPSATVASDGGDLAGAGRWFVWLGSSTGLGNNGNPFNADLAGYGDQAGANLGRNNTGAGDTNNDGLSELYVPAWRYSNGEAGEGAVFGYSPPDDVIVAAGEPIQFATAMFEGWPTYQDIFDAVQMAIDDYGLLKGFSIQHHEYDSACSPTGGTDAANAIAANFQNTGVVGPFCSSATSAAAQVLESKGVVMISPSSTAPNLELNGPNVFNRVVVSEPEDVAWTEKVDALPSVQTWEADFESEYGHAPDGFAKYAYDAASLLLTKIDEVGYVDAGGNLVVDRSDLRTAVRITTDYTGVTDLIAFDPYGTRIDTFTYDVWTDKFSDSTLNQQWSWLNEDPTHWSLSANPGFLRIITQQDSSVNQLTQAAPIGDFEIRARLLFTPTQNFHFAGLSVYLDAENQLAIGRAFSNKDGDVGNGIYFDSVVGNVVSDTNYSITTTLDSEAYLRLVREGTDYSGFVSMNGTEWTELGTHSAEYQPAYIGNFAHNNLQDITELPADFDFFVSISNDSKIYLPAIEK